jgi:hypothetical protein
VKRAYGSEPVLLDISPITAALAVTKSRRRKQRVLGLLLAAGLLAVVGGTVWWVQHNHRQVLPAGLHQAANYPLYSPGWLPSGARLDPASADATSQVVTFAFTYDGAKKLIFTEQLKPSGFDFDTFYNDQLTEKQTFSTNLGQATVGLFENSPFASVITDRTWIIMRAPMNMDSEQFIHVVRNLRAE